jgi:hypothetical protein
LPSIAHLLTMTDTALCYTRRVKINSCKLQIPIPPPPLCPCRFKRLAGLDLAGELLHKLAPVSADPSPIAHQAHGPEQVS